MASTRSLFHHRIDDGLWSLTGKLARLWVRLREASAAVPPANVAGRGPAADPAGATSGEQLMLSHGPLWPEFATWLATRRSEQIGALPLLRDDSGFGDRALTWWASQRGQSRFEQQLAAEQRAALRLARMLRPSQNRLVVPQTLLPHLWSAGVLAGRSFEVMLSRPPLSALQAELDRCALVHPASRTHDPFRAPPALLLAESQALAAASQLHTPFPQIHHMFGTRSRLLDWCSGRPLPLLRPRRTRPRLLFPLATAARHGAFELRTALAGLDVQLVLLGSEQEGPEFWTGLQTVRLRGELDWRREVDLLVLPAWTCGRPGLLLQARAAGIPVICSPACGLRPGRGVELVDAGEVSGLRALIDGWLQRRQARSQPSA